MSFPPTYSFPVYEGDTTAFDLTYKEGPAGEETGKTLTGATLLSQIRETRESVAAITTMTVTADADQVTNPGLMSVTLPAANSTLLTGVSYVYDIEVTWPDLSVQTILQGTITVTKGVSE